MSSRLRAFAVIAVTLMLIATGYVGLSLVRGDATSRASADVANRAVERHTLAELLRQPHLVFLEPGLTDRTKNQLAVAPLAAPRAYRIMTGLRCSRVYAIATYGVCLGENYDGLSHFLDGTLRPSASFVQAGIASRARVSPDGRWISTTTFVSGHSYAVAGFSTQTIIYDTGHGVATSLESFAVSRDGHRIDAPDFNFWGVTFAGGAGFYATLGTGGHRYLIKGDLLSHTARVLRDGVECPSLSPAGTRIVYKAAVPGSPGTWHLHLLDLGTMSDVALGESRSVDDQVAWLDDRTVLYGLRDSGTTLDMSLWALPVDGGPPVLYQRHAESPAVVRDSPRLQP